MTIGQPLPRPDGRAKVTGAARYAADHNLPNQLHAALVTAPIPAGRVVAINSGPALAARGVVRVLTESDLPRFGQAPSPPLASAFVPMQGDEIRHEGQPVAIVLGETLEAAEHGARLVRVHYELGAFAMPGDAPVSGPSNEVQHAHEPNDKSGYLFAEAQFRKGDFQAGLASAAHRHEAVYSQPSRHNNPMEPSATLAHWQGDRLTSYDAVQHGYSAQFVLSAMLNVPPENVRVICPHTGGGFGAKGYVWPHQVLAAAAARIAGRPVKLVLSRSQMYSNVGYQPQIVQFMTLGSDADGRLTALGHDVINVTGVSDDFVEFATMASTSLYATPALHTSQRVERCNVNLPTAMRAPVDGRAPGRWKAPWTSWPIRSGWIPSTSAWQTMPRSIPRTESPGRRRSSAKRLKKGRACSAGASGRESRSGTGPGLSARAWRVARWARSASPRRHACA
jgi:xanthine dehydrogenase YagR molybdenum-binding subunit